MVICFFQPNKPEKPEKPGKPGKLGGKPGGKPEGKPKGQDGVCISGGEMIGICTANTDFQEKLKEAVSTCLGENLERGLQLDMRAKKPIKGKGKGKGKGKPGKKPSKGKGKPAKECPTAEEFLEMAFEKLEGIVAVLFFRTKHDQQIEDDLCILSEIGWVDDDLAAINETFVEDMNSFPENISASLTGEEFDQCIEKVESLGSKSGK